MSVRRTVYDVFSVKEWRDLENGGRGCSRSLKMASRGKIMIFDQYIALSPKWYKIESQLLWKVN